MTLGDVRELVCHELVTGAASRGVPISHVDVLAERKRSGTDGPRQLTGLRVGVQPHTRQIDSELIPESVRGLCLQTLTPTSPAVRQLLVRVGEHSIESGSNFFSHAR